SGRARLGLLDFGMTVTLPREIRLAFCQVLHALSELSVSGLSRAINRLGYQNSQSQLHPERDLEYFAFLMRDTGTRKEQRALAKEFSEMRDAQREEDIKAAPDGKVEGRYFKEFPDALLFLMRTLGLIRGLCTTLNVPVSYLEGMIDHAR